MINVQVDRVALEPLVHIADGAVGSVYKTPFKLPGTSIPLAYKEFQVASPSDLSSVVKSFRRAVAFRSALSEADKLDLDARSVWPLEIVTHEGHIAGGLMPLIPQDYFTRLRPPHLHGKEKSVPRGLEVLSYPSRRAKQAGFSQSQLHEFSDRVVRAAVLAQLVYGIARLHKHGIVYGDISLKNAVFTPNPPAVILLDCDAVASLSDGSRSQTHSPFFLPPECEAPGSNPHARSDEHFQDLRTDVYKLGLCVIRGMSVGAGATQVRNTDHLVGDIPNSVIHTIDQAVNLNPDARPSAKELYLALKSFVDSKTLPPTIKYFRSNTNVVPRGEDVVFEWEVAGAATAFILDPNGVRTPVDPDWGRWTMPVGKSGVYELEISRRGMVVKQPAEFIHAFNMPEFDITTSTQMQKLIPTIPQLPPAEVNSVLESLPVRPAVENGTDIVPELPSLSAESLLEQIGTATGYIASTDRDNGDISEYRPAHPAVVGSINEVASFLHARNEAVRRVLSDAENDLKVALERATESNVTDAIKRIEYHVAENTRKLTHETEPPEGRD